MGERESSSHSILRGLQRLISDLQTPAAGTHPLSSIQEGIARSYAATDAPAAWHVGVVIKVTGGLCLKSFESALDQLQRRQAVLRSSVTSADGALVMSIAETCVTPLLQTNVEALAPDLQQQFEQQTIQDDLAWRFDLSVAPLWRVRLIRRSADEYVLIFVFHQLVADLPSLEIAFAELSEHYAAAVAGSQPWLPPLRTSFGEAVLGLPAHPKEVEETPAWSYWQRLLQGIPRDPSATSWTMAEEETQDVPPKSASVPGCQFRRLDFPPEFSEALRVTALRASASTGAVILAALAVAFRGVLGGRDVLIATEAPGRTEEGEEELIGSLSNFLTVRAVVDEAVSFTKLVERVGSQLSEAFLQSDIPFALLWPLAFAASPTQRVAPRLLVNFSGRGWELPEFGDTQSTLLDLRRGSGVFDLTLDLRESHEGLSGWISFDTSSIPPAHLDGFLQSFESLLHQALHQPDQSVAQLLVLWQKLQGPAGLSSAA